RRDSCRSALLTGARARAVANLSARNACGGREGTRTPDPLLAKQARENTKCFVWCCLHEKSTKLPLLNGTEVVPKLWGEPLRWHNFLGPVFHFSGIQGPFSDASWKRSEKFGGSGRALHPCPLLA